MGRWEPGARGRLLEAALELYEERGFEGTTTAEIAERAGVTERTFFRHFADKREVLFDGSADLEGTLAEAVASAPPGTAPLDAVGDAFAALDAFFEERRAFSLRRAAVVAAAPRLQERELLKLASMRDSLAAALRGRGLAEPAASMVAEAGIGAFRIGFEAWVAAAEPRPPLADCVRQALDALREHGLSGRPVRIGTGPHG
ncbi:TetR/AcrR family transcriptional regulator [Isoptericola sp. BMS4]|uniref:TetR/AcrR family transcriptional regulator n=1 Tax=Isoptericola sp. BMS4 TaxID=2527875 RepID=UPI001423527B|nr:TetR family transcriptional regulator [Isoptericola sp. BMS4]